MATGIELKATDGTNDVYPALHGTQDGAAYVSAALNEKIAGEDLGLDRMVVAPKYSYRNIVCAASPQSTAAVKNAPGILHGVMVNIIGAASSKLEVYDALTAAGTVIFAIPLTATGLYLFDAELLVGLSVKMTDTGNTASITLLYV